MPPSISAAQKNLEALVTGLRGQRLTTVVYYTLSAFDDDELAVEWDFGDWHEPTMGAELSTSDGHRYSAIWNDTFGEFGIEMFPKPMDEFLGGSVAVPVSDHHRWAGLIGRKIIAADICWRHYPDTPIPVPLAIRLGFRKSTIWIAAGVSQDQGSSTNFQLGSDDVMVVFTQEMSARIGLPGPP